MPLFQLRIYEGWSCSYLMIIGEHLGNALAARSPHAHPRHGPTQQWCPQKSGCHHSSYWAKLFPFVGEDADAQNRSERLMLRHLGVGGERKRFVQCPNQRQNKYNHART